MARTLQQITEAHLGQLTFQAIQMAYQIEQQELRVRELEARVQELTPAPTEAPDGR